MSDLVGSPMFRYAAALLLLAVRVDAQSSRFGADIAVGLTSASGGEYTNAQQSVKRLAVDARLATFGSAVVLFQLETDRASHLGDFVNICVVGSNTQCVSEFPDLTTYAAGFALRQTVDSIRSFTLRLGSGMVTATDARGRASVADRSSVAFLASFDIGVRTIQRVWLTFGAHYMEAPHLQDAALHIKQGTVGLRVF